MTSDRFDTRPSETPKMTARSVPDRALRCQRSAPVIALGAAAGPAATAGCSSAVTASAAAARRTS